MINRYQVSQQIIANYGMANQLDKAVEELKELIHELEAAKCGFADQKGINTEIADVENMLLQLKIIFGNFKEVEIERDHKLKRQLQRIKEGC